ncbi:uncharacterized protein AC631_05312 [Debaryomyces fabryi]|uniref:tRNA-splicing endonuclease subunit Sen15 domain-containing protein n=1 Tax=Debaryomyces fabryi TaxID=58627 RepID=A0A0V1PRP8_9ASCO|nr:uncharacterized protein AC631_05312 [Debaryomyces fabryi]KRZ98925.1 hypothetical protein AC631_05312 [Debaryomyces fabryi]CUM46718.1 unnamed protein product [Debaryomyces fabryi]
MSLANQVETNLVHHNLWSDVKRHEIANYNDTKITILRGKPPAKLETGDEDGSTEWVVPKLMTSKNDMNITEIDNWFVQISQLSDPKIRPLRITIGLVNDDATVVYYFIHDGIVKPRQN